MEVVAILAVPFSLLLQATPPASPPPNSPPATQERESAAAQLTADGYRDLVVTVADPVRSLQNRVLTGLSPDRRCFTVDTTQARLAADTAGEFAKEWSKHKVPDALKASHVEMLSWIRSAQGQLQTVPACLEGGSMPLLVFLSTFGQYNDLRTRAGSLLKEMGVTLPPMPDEPKPKAKR